MQDLLDVSKDSSGEEESSSVDTITLENILNQFQWI